jgi:hypothetical protein
VKTRDTRSNITVPKRFVSGKDVETFCGIKNSTLERDRFTGKNRFPFYPVGGRILYDLREIEAIILASRQGGELTA